MLGSICCGSEGEGWQQLPRGVELLSFLLKVPYYSCISATRLLHGLHWTIPAAVTWAGQFRRAAAALPGGVKLLSAILKVPDYSHMSVK